MVMRIWVALTMLWPAIAWSGPIVAVFDMEDRGSGLDSTVLVNLTDYLADLLSEGGFQVVPRDQVKERIARQKSDSYKACYDQSCQVKLGKELAAEKSLASRIYQIGGVCKVTASLYDLAKATSETAATEGAECNEKDLLLAVERVARKITGRPVEPLSHAVPQRPTGSDIPDKVERRPSAQAPARQPQPAQQQPAGRPEPGASPQPVPSNMPSQPVWSIEKLKFHLAARGGVQAGSLSDAQTFDVGDYSKKIDTGFLFDASADFVFLTGMSFGACLWYIGTGVEGDHAVNLLMVGGRSKGHFPSSRDTEFRLVFSMGAGFFPATEDIEGIPVGDAVGLAFDFGMEFVWYLNTSLGLLANLSAVGFLSGDDDPPVGLSNALLLMSIGMEFGS
jgi:hypothetical protein